MSDHIGEWWLTEHDQIYCDGETGVDVPNHEAVVIAHCAGLVADALEANDDRFSREAAAVFREYAEEGIVDVIALREALCLLCDHWVDANLLTTEEADDIYETLRHRSELDAKIVATATGSEDDARELGLKFGWVRVIGNHFQVQQLTRDVWQRMADFAYEQEHNEWYLEVIDYRGKRVFLAGLSLVDFDSYRSLVKAVQRVSVPAG